jgi:hypothetical protein
MRIVDYGCFDPLYIEREGISENKNHEEGEDKNHDQTPGIPEDVEEFLDDDGFNASHDPLQLA